MSGGPAALLLDVEGTTTPLSFVSEVLFPYARQALPAALAARPGALGEELGLLAADHAREVAAGEAPPAWDGREPAGAARFGLWLMDRDRKATGLKALQGKLWEEGYRAGALRGQVFPDLLPALRRWRGQGRRVAIYSSGSVLAQRLLFGHSEAGDLTSWLEGYFDTTTGPKREPESYVRIAAALALPPARVLFLSDVLAELDAARAAGLATLHSLRGVDPAGPTHPTFASLAEVLPEA